MQRSLDERYIEETLLGGPLRYTSKEIEEVSGIPQEYALRIWTALGFPTPPEDERAFTDRDIEALNEIKQLLASDLVDEAMVLNLSRAVGQTMGRLASWLGGVWMQQLADLVPGAVPGPGAGAGAGGEPIDDEMVAGVLAATGELRPRFEQLLLHGWRRQLAAAGLRAFSTSATSDPATGIAQLSVGFADVVSFTRLSRQMGGAELADFVERFEVTAAGHVAELGGRVVKTLGDEILFAADDPRGAAEIGLRISEACTSDPDLPQVRVGLAHGEVLLRLGDVFGTPVNLAARLTSAAYPGAVLVNSVIARALEADPAYDIAGLRPRPLQGLGRVRPHVLRRARS